jgi:hypothetical protein
MKIRGGREPLPHGFPPRRFIEGRAMNAEEGETGFGRSRAAKQCPEGEPMYDALSVVTVRQERQGIDVWPPDRILLQRNPPMPLTLRRKLYLIERKSVRPIAEVGR